MRPIPQSLRNQNPAGCELPFEKFMTKAVWIVTYFCAGWLFAQAVEAVRIYQTMKLN